MFQLLRCVQKALQPTLEYKYVFVPELLNFEGLMEQKIKFKYLNDGLNIGVFDLKNVYILRQTLKKTPTGSL